MAAPSTALSTLRPELAGSLTQFDLAMDRQGFVGARVLPIFEAGAASGHYGRVKLESLLEDADVERAPDGSYARSNWKFDDIAFVTVERGAEEVVDENKSKVYANYFNFEQVCTQRAYDRVLRAQERRVAALLCNTTTYTGSDLTAAAGTAWSTHASADPREDVRAARQKVWGNTGLWANAVVMGQEAFDHCVACAAVIDSITAKGAGQPAKPRDVTKELLAQALNVDYVFVAGSARNSANPNATRSISSIWTRTHVMVCRVATTNDIEEPCIGRTIHWAEDGSQPGGTVETYRDETRRADIVRVRHQVVEKLHYPEMGFLITAAIS